MTEFPFQAVIHNIDNSIKTVVVKIGWSKNKKQKTKVGELPNGTIVEVCDTTDHVSCVAYRISFDPRDNVDGWVKNCPGSGWVKNYNVRVVKWVDPFPEYAHLTHAPAPPPLLKRVKIEEEDCGGIWGTQPSAEDFVSASASSSSTTPITTTAEGPDPTSRVMKDGVAIFNAFTPSDYGP